MTMTCRSASNHGRSTFTPHNPRHSTPLRPCTESKGFHLMTLSLRQSTGKKTIATIHTNTSVTAMDVKEVRFHWRLSAQSLLSVALKRRPGLVIHAPVEACWLVYYS